MNNYTKLYLLPTYIYFNTCLFPLSAPHLHALALISLLNEIKGRISKMLEGKS